MFQKQKKLGFTLLEMIVVVGIFSLMVVVIASILNSIFLSRKVTVAREKLQSDSNSIVEIIAKDSRISRVDYQRYSVEIPGVDLTTPQEVLFLVDKDDNRIAYKKASGSSCSAGLPGDYDCLVVAVGSEQTNITPKDVEVADVKFYIEPAADPFAQDPAGRPNKQPLVTVSFKTEANIAEGQGKVSNLIQTSISPRLYQQRVFSP